MIGIICAMESELQAVLEHVKEEKTEQVGQVRVHYGTLDGKKIAACLSGVGKVNAAMAATILCQVPDLELLLNVGVAGGLKEEQSVCDLVIGDKVVQADFDTSPIDGEAGIGLSFPVKEELVEKAVRAAHSINIPYHVGCVATQDLFMSRPEDYDRLLSRFADSACSEMEGGAIAQVAAAFDKPFLVLRTLSDVAVHEDNPLEFSEFTKKASRQAADVVKALCALM